MDPLVTGLLLLFTEVSAAGRPEELVNYIVFSGREPFQKMKIASQTRSRIVLLSVLAIVSCEIPTSERQFMQREIRGVIIGLEDQGRGTCKISINDKSSRSKQDYILFISQFVAKHEITPGDSISKEANSWNATFFRSANDGKDKKIQLRY